MAALGRARCCWSVAALPWSTEAPRPKRDVRSSDDASFLRLFQSRRTPRSAIAVMRTVTASDIATTTKLIMTRGSNVDWYHVS